MSTALIGVQYFDRNMRTKVKKKSLIQSWGKTLVICGPQGVMTESFDRDRLVDTTHLGRTILFPGASL